MGDSTLHWCASPDWPLTGCVLVRVVDGSAYIVGSYCADGDRHEGVDDDGIEDTMGIPATREVVRWWLGASGGCGRSIVRGYAQDVDAAQAAIEAVADALCFVGVDVDGGAVWQTEPSGDSGELEATMGDLPKLPPGWRWWGPVDGVVGVIPPHRADDPDALPGLDPHTGFTDAPDSVQRVADSAAALTAATLRAALKQAATDAGVVLPEGFDVGAVLRDGVRTHGWWWSASPTGIRFLHSPDGAFVLYPGGDWMGPGPRPRYGTVSADTPEADSQALWDAVGPKGLPMPPLPGVSDG